LALQLEYLLFELLQFGALGFIIVSEASAGQSDANEQNKHKNCDCFDLHIQSPFNCSFRAVAASYTVFGFQRDVPAVSSAGGGSEGRSSQ